MQNNCGGWSLEAKRAEQRPNSKQQFENNNPIKKNAAFLAKYCRAFANNKVVLKQWKLLIIQNRLLTRIFENHEGTAKQVQTIIPKKK